MTYQQQKNKYSNQLKSTNKTKDRQNQLEIFSLNKYENQSLINCLLLYQQTKNKNDIHLLFKLASIYKQQNILDKALQFFQKIIQLVPENAQILQELGCIQLKKNVIQFKQNYDKALQYFKQMYKYSYLKYQSLIYIAEVYEILNMVDKQIKALKMALNPLNVFAYIKLGYAYLKKNDINRSLDIFQKAYSLDNKSDDILFGYTKSLIISHKVQNINKALVLLAERIKKNNNNKQFFILMSMALQKHSQHQNALKILQMNQFQNEEILYYKGILCIKQQKYEQAFKFFKEAVKKNKNFTPAIIQISKIYNIFCQFQKSTKLLQTYGIQDNFLIANSYYLQHKYQEAIYYYKKSLKNESLNYVIYCRIGECYYKIQNYQKSRKYFKKSLSLEKFNWPAWKGMALLQKQYEQYQSAINYFDQASKYYYLQYEDLQMMKGKADCLMMMKYCNDARSIYKKIMDLVQDQQMKCNNYLCIGLTYAMEQNFPLSIYYFQEAIKLNFNKAQVHYNLGLSYIKMCLYTKAQNQFEIAIKIDNNYSLAYYNLGNLKFILDQKNEGFQLIEKAIELNQQNIEWRNEISKLYQAQKRYFQAIDHLVYLFQSNPNLDKAIRLAQLYYKNNQIDNLQSHMKKTQSIFPQNQEIKKFYNMHKIKLNSHCSYKKQRIYKIKEEPNQQQD